MRVALGPVLWGVRQEFPPSLARAGAVLAAVSSHCKPTDLARVTRGPLLTHSPSCQEGGFNCGTHPSSSGYSQSSWGSLFMPALYRSTLEDRQGALQGQQMKTDLYPRDSPGVASQLSRVSVPASSQVGSGPGSVPLAPGRGAELYICCSAFLRPQQTAPHST